MPDRKFNSMYFDDMDEALAFIRMLLQMSLTENSEKDGSVNTSWVHANLYNDIHVYTEDVDGIIVEWAQIPYEHDYGGQFKFVDHDEEVMKECIFPDNHSEYFSTNDMYQESLREWLQEHPTYTQDSCGRWYDKKEYESLNN